MTRSIGELPPASWGAAPVLIAAVELFVENSLRVAREADRVPDEHQTRSRPPGDMVEISPAGHDQLARWRERPSTTRSSPHES
jgi:hypothetical protein